MLYEPKTYYLISIIIDIIQKLKYTVIIIGNYIQLKIVG